MQPHDSDIHRALASLPTHEHMRLLAGAILAHADNDTIGSVVGLISIAVGPWRRPVDRRPCQRIITSGRNCSDMGPAEMLQNFWATDLGRHIALGWKYCGQRVQQAPVVYVALEGRAGLPARKEAFARHHAIEEAPFYLMTTPLNPQSRLMRSLPVLKPN